MPDLSISSVKLVFLCAVIRSLCGGFGSLANKISERALIIEGDLLFSQKDNAKKVVAESWLCPNLLTLADIISEKL